MTDNEEIDPDIDNHLDEINEYYLYLEKSDYIDLSWNKIRNPNKKAQQKAEESPKPEIAQQQTTSVFSFQDDFQDEPSPSTKSFGGLAKTQKGTMSLKKTKTTFSAIMDKVKNKYSKQT